MTRQVYTTSNGMVLEYIKILDRVVNELNSISDKRVRVQNILLSILLSIAVVETFINLFFQVTVLKSPYSLHKEFIANSLKSFKSIDFKIKKWPKMVFGKELDLTTGIGKQFVDLKNLRNRLMHFSTLGNVKIDGKGFDTFSDISFYESLEIPDAHNASNVAEETILEILKLSGLTGDKLTSQRLRWTGKRHV
jgi:hypothetical protein